MRKNKGFTLVEVLAVLVVLAVIGAIITTNVFDSLETASNVAYNKQIEELINASKMYINKNPNLLDNNENVITIQELIDSRLISGNKVINPKTHTQLTGCILVKYENNKYNYEYTADENNCN